MKKRFVNSEELKNLLYAVRDNVATSEQRTRLGEIATHIANIVIRTPSVRRFLAYNDSDGFLDLENQMKAQVQIVIIGTCPYTYDENAGLSYSYCLYCANSEVCDVIRRHNYRCDLSRAVQRVYKKVQDKLFPRKICTDQARMTGEFATEFLG